MTERFQTVGSGVVIDAEHGYLVTNHHVVRKAQQIQITLLDRRQFDAQLVGVDTPIPSSPEASTPRRPRTPNTPIGTTWAASPTNISQ